MNMILQVKQLLKSMHTKNGDVTETDEDNDEDHYQDKATLEGRTFKTAT